jgi:hypothetical protein
MVEEVGGAKRGVQEVQEGRNECRNAQRHLEARGGKGKSGEVCRADTGTARGA